MRWLKFLLENDKLIRARCGQSITPVIALARSSKKNALIPITHSVEEILNADVDVFVELMGGVDEAFKIVSEILKKKKLLLLQIKLCLLIIVMNLKIWLSSLWL